MPRKNKITPRKKQQPKSRIKHTTIRGVGMIGTGMGKSGMKRMMTISKQRKLMGY